MTNNNNTDIMHSSRNKKIWSRLKSASCFRTKKGKSRKGEDSVDALTTKLNVNEEYKEVFRTQSYIDICSKVQVQLKGSSLPTFDPNFSNNNDLSPSTSSPLPPFFMHLSDCLLEPRQEAVDDIIKSSKGSKLRSLFIDYFEASLEACNICELLLEGIHKTRSNHRFIKRVIKLYGGGKEGGVSLGSNYTKNGQCRDMIIRELDSFTRLRNPLSVINGAVDFHKVHDKYALLLRKLTSRKRKIKRREKFTRFSKKAVGYGFVVGYALLAIAMLGLAMHSVVGLLGLPGLLLTVPSGAIKKNANGVGVREVSFLQGLVSQLDVAARGVYILINDFDTVGRLVRRLHDDVEHTRVLAEMCVRNRKSHEVVKEALRELHMHEEGFAEQLEELEEHIYLCFLTINRSRRLVIQQILSPT